MSLERLVYPAIDAGPNDGSPQPTPPSTHWDKVDEDPHDGATTRLIFTALGAEAFGVLADAVLATDQILSYRVRWAAENGAGALYEARAGLRISGIEYLGPARVLPAAVGVFEEPFPVDPFDGKPWTKERIIRAELFWRLILFDIALPRPYLTQLIGVALVVEGLERPVGTVSGAAPRAATVEDLDTLQVRVSASAPQASVTSASPKATASSSPPKSEGA